jgi:Acetylornithine deacetylase/Succinyl-diaminopimelate desuccinylase and related deacylases
MAARVHSLMPEVTRDLAGLVRCASVSLPGHPEAPVRAAAEKTLALLKKYGISSARFLEIPGGYPAVYAEIPAPPGAPTVLLYAHYDVQPAQKEDGWATDPFAPVEKDGRLFGRGTADDKSGILIIAAALSLFSGHPLVGVKVVIEGEEETESHLDAYVAAHPDFFACDAFVILDNGNLDVRQPALTTTLRGVVSCIIEVSTLDHPVHSGMFGGAASDALVALIAILSTLHDPAGRVAVQGLRVSAPPGTEYPEAHYREGAGVLPGTELTGTGPLGARLWSEPSVSVIGIDAPSVAGSANILIPRARAKVSLRIAPDADPARELSLLVAHLQAAAPWGANVVVTETGRSAGFVCPPGHPATAAAKEALAIAFGKPVREKGSGGSIPLLSLLHAAAPEAGFVLIGAEDTACSRIHGTNESVDLGEVERCITGLALFFTLFSREKKQA